MTPELGHLALILAFLVALVQGILPIVGAYRGQAAWIAIARPAAQTQFVLVVIAYACLTMAFVNKDYSVAYVAEHSNSQLPLHYRIAAVWGGHEGSLLLWMLMLNGWTFAVSMLSRQLPRVMVARVIGVLGLVASGFLAFILFTSNPFERVLPAAADGQDLNPVLQDPGLVFHPPMLYMGYVGFSVAFAFAIAALLSGRLDAAWARWSRPWTIVAWMFLTVGIALGSWWAYYELGWGGWWFWDPVENASFMPWLVGTALIHSLAVTEKRGSFKNWTVLLAIGAFSLSLLGTFLVRSGVLTSVHAFASDPRRGIFILALLVVVIGGSLTLFAWRAQKVGLGGSFALLSRETLLLVNNVLLVTAAASVLLGTLYPLFIDALGLGKLSVGPPYFNSVFVPIMVPLLVLIAIGPLARWKRLDERDIARRLRVPAIAAVVAGAVLPFAMGHWSPLVAMGLMLATWIATSGALQIRARLRAGAPPRSFWAMQIAHIGIAVFVVGVTLVKGYEVEKDVRMGVGDTVEIGGYVVRFGGVREAQGPNYVAQVGTIELARDGRMVRTLAPEKRSYFSSQMPMTVTAIDTSPVRDMYVSLGERLSQPGQPEAWSVRVYYKPFVVWIWTGCLLMAIGGGFAVADRRYRMRRTALAAQGSGRVKRFLLPLILFLGLVVFLAVGLTRDPRELPSPLIGRAAPPFELPRLAVDTSADAGRFGPADMRGKVWLLNVWASWCVSCRQEHPVLLDIARRGDVPLIGLDYKDAVPDARAWLEQHGNPYQLSAVDADGRVGIDYGVYGVPETYLIDQRGTIRFKQIGPLTAEVLEKTILPLVQKLRK